MYFNERPEYLTAAFDYRKSRALAAIKFLSVASPQTVAERKFKK
jgi:hypothetical protein